MCCAGTAAAQSVTVFAASSLKNALDEVAAAYTRESGVAVTVSYAGTAVLARQIDQGAPADVFISASTDWMDWLEGRGGIAPASRRDLLSNRLVLIRHGQGAALSAGALGPTLANTRLAMAFVQAIPAGQYGKAALESLGLWQTLSPNVVQLDSVRAALALVALGEAEYGIVYASDALAEPRVSTVFTFPETSHQPIRYPVALTPQASPEAAAFLQALSSKPALAVFEKHGFLRVPE